MWRFQELMMCCQATLADKLYCQRHFFWRLIEEGGRRSEVSITRSAHAALSMTVPNMQLLSLLRTVIKLTRTIRTAFCCLPRSPQKRKYRWKKTLAPSTKSAFRAQTSNK